MEHQSVYFLAHHMRYKDNKTIQDIQKLDKDIIETYISVNIGNNDYNKTYQYINKDYIDNKNTLTLHKSVAYNILYLVYRLRTAFEARIKQKDICFLKIKHKYNNKNGLINGGYLSPDQQFNLYLYMFNENSSVRIVNNYLYISEFRNLVNITLDVMKNYK
tara:strand:+ start:1181 stop:1663 length:483 start_codon:yes stop_codon:yes gene_type:complete